MDTRKQDTQPIRKCFRIWVAGRLDERFVDGEERIELGRSSGGSTIEGTFIDQSQIRGVLDRLWQLGIEVIKFETYLQDRDESDI